MNKSPFSDRLQALLHYTPVHQVIARKDSAELILMRGIDQNRDPEYWLLSDKRFAVFGMTGMVRSISKVDGQSLEQIVNRNSGYGLFHSSNGVLLEPEIDSVYRFISGMAFFDERHVGDFQWGSQQLITRFGDYNNLVDPSDIIPEFGDQMTVLKIGSSCPRHCIYCPAPSAKGGVIYSRNKVDSNLKNAVAMEQKHHGSHLHKMTELFFNASDILWGQFAILYKNGELDAVAARMAHRLSLDDQGLEHISNVPIDRIPGPVELVGTAKLAFPNKQKFYAFFGVPTVNAVPIGYLHELSEAGINRAYIGIESFHSPASAFLGKNESAEEKEQAVKKLLKAGIPKVKLIVQVGMLGSEFTYKGHTYSSHESLVETARYLGKVAKDGRISISISENIPVPGTPLASMHRTAVRGYTTTLPGEESAKLKSLLQAEGIDVYARVHDYADALESRQRPG